MYVNQKVITIKRMSWKLQKLKRCKYFHSNRFKTSWRMQWTLNFNFQCRWAKVGVIKEICLIAKTIVMYGRDCFLQFHNLNTGEDSYLTLNTHKENGDGIKCFRGHPTLNIFAYAENCHEANIYVKTYPDFQLINKFPGMCLSYFITEIYFYIIPALLVYWVKRQTLSVSRQININSKIRKPD